MNDEPLPPPSKRRGRPPGLLDSARAILARTDLKNRRFVLGPWLESLHPRRLAAVHQEVEALVNNRATRCDAPVIAMLFLNRELPGAKGCFREELICDALTRLLILADLEEMRREGRVTFRGDPALSGDDWEVAAPEDASASVAETQR